MFIQIENNEVFIDDSIKLAVVLDIDETLLNSVPKWTVKLNELIGLSLTERDIEVKGGVDGVFEDTDLYNKFLQIASFLRADLGFNADMPPIHGAQKGIERLLRIPNLQILFYLTARPCEVAAITKLDLINKGFPDLPVIARPSSLPRNESPQWKLSLIDNLSQAVNSTIIMIDDSLSLAGNICKRNQGSTKKIVSILLNGPITYTSILDKNVVSRPGDNFFVADWQDIPALVEDISNSAFPQM